MQSLRGRMTVMIGAAALMILMMMGMSALAKRAGKPRNYREPDSFAALRYPYRQLDERSRELYLALYSGISNYDAKIVLPDSYTAEEYRSVYLLLTTQEPEFFYLDTVYETAAEMRTAEMFYIMAPEDAQSKRKELEAAADAVLNRAAGQTDMQRLLSIHDWICSRCSYVNAPLSDTAYGCLVNGTARCEGYAKAFLYIARRAGIDVMSVPGMTDKGEAHLWNIAAADGAYYNFDVTWDDDSAYQGVTTHTCFAVPDSVFGDHMPDRTLLSPPACTESAKNYYQMRGMVLTEAAGLTNALQRWNGAVPERIIEFRCADAGTFEQTKNMLRSDPAVHSVLESITGGVNTRIIADEKRTVVVILT